MQVQNFDDRPPLARMRRIELWRLADQYNVKYPVDATKDTMLSILEGVDLSKPPAPALKVEEPEDVPLEDMSLFQLRSVCKERGIEFAKTDTRVMLLEKLAG